ncbi:MAG: hypothetical protein ABEJ87_05995 [Candidatus Nanohalobium sp.]
MTELSDETVSVLESIGELTENILDEDEIEEYLYSEGAGAEIWELLTLKKGFSNEEVQRAMDELLEKNLLDEREVEEIKNRLVGLPAESSVWYKEKNTKYVFSEELEEYI